MKTMEGTLFWDDLEPGMRYRSRGRTITETDLVNFVNASWLTEGLFTSVDPAEREHSAISGRVVPGALVYSYAEGMSKYTMQGIGLAFLEATMVVKGPTRVGDTIHVECEVTEKKMTSKPGRAVMRSLVDVVNQHGQTVLTYTAVRLVRAPGCISPSTD
ncbi:MaoC family dehydratase [Hydrogenophaga sp. BPS33]|uniref:MaoC family dehydratase n=1 Tax=Hydrogenophaga sp. BPS33 TaxID=2651974 RepID=UPI001320293B|nr:MaoC family dehydratase N-terminal domain-containing protein [Hydrogenophaga sp. BPS33]QHE84461.1 acyl dehydratase [Hydrogenophaga sp. BPS33]